MMDNPHAVKKETLEFVRQHIEKLPECSVFRLHDDLAFNMFVKKIQQSPTNPLEMISTLKDYRANPPLINHLQELTGEWLITKITLKPAEYGGFRNQEMMSSGYTLYEASPITADNQVNEDIVIMFRWSRNHINGNDPSLVMEPHRHVVRHVKVWYE